MKKKVTVAIFLIVAAIAFADFTIPPPEMPYSSTPVIESNVNSIAPIPSPFDTFQIDPGDNSDENPINDSSSGNTPNNGAGNNQANTGSSGGSGGGGGGGGARKINVLDTPTSHELYIGQPAYFVRNGRTLPLPIILRKGDVAQKTTEWVMNGKFYPVPLLGSQEFDATRDGITDVELRVLEISRRTVNFSVVAAGLRKEPVAPVLPPAMPVPRYDPVPYTPPPETPADDFPSVPFTPPEFNELPFTPVQEATPGETPLFWYLTIPLFLIVAGGLYFFITHLRGQGNDLKEYVEHGLKMGYSTSEIEKRLIDAGWDRDSVKSATNKLKSGKNF